MVAREAQNVNPEMPTGEVELDVAAADKLADADTPPFPIDEEREIDELVRMRYRYLDLRRDRQRDTLILRDRVNQTIRRTLGDRDFVEIETPMLTRSTPEGARDFLVPSRNQRGSFFALPQSPQIFKQLLMVAGLRALLPDRPLLPRRGPAGRPPARVHPARPGDVLRGRGGRDRASPRP